MDVKYMLLKQLYQFHGPSPQIFLNFCLILQENHQIYFLYTKNSRKMPKIRFHRMQSFGAGIHLFGKVFHKFHFWYFGCQNLWKCFQKHFSQTHDFHHNLPRNRLYSISRFLSSYCKYLNFLTAHRFWAKELFQKFTKYLLKLKIRKYYIFQQNGVFNQKHP